MRAGLLALIILLAPSAAGAQTCPEPLASARRLALVTANSMETKFARLALYERKSHGDSWRPLGKPEAVMLGKHGLAWGRDFQQLARPGEPIKREGDKRTPAGIFRIGAPFGFARSKRTGYVRVKTGETFCVDDVRSPAYNTITTLVRAGRVTGERMWTYPEYRHGLFIDYPSKYPGKAGSCIFIHVWSAPGEGTAGCISMPARRVVALQDFSEAGAVIAIAPQSALGRFAGCLPMPARR